MKGFGIGLILSSLFKGIVKLFNAIITIIAYIMLYFGLWVPSLYMIFIVILMLALKFDVTIVDTNTILFYTGLLLSLACSLVITAKNFIFKPIGEINTHFENKREQERRALIEKAAKLLKRNPDKYYKRYGNALPIEVPDLPRKAQQEKPLIYRSKRNPSIIIHEYINRFDVFRDIDGKIQYIESKKKLKP